MSGQRVVTYALELGTRSQRRNEKPLLSPCGDPGSDAIPRIARLMALAIRFEGMRRDRTIRDYADLARLGGVTRARVTQIMKLLNLAPDIQEKLLFLPSVRGMTERNLRPVINRIDWDEQRELLAGMAVFHHSDDQ